MVGVGVANGAQRLGARLFRGCMILERLERRCSCVSFVSFACFRRPGLVFRFCRSLITVIVVCVCTSDMCPNVTSIFSPYNTPIPQKNTCSCMRAPPLKVHVLPTDTLGQSLGPTGYFHHTEPWPDAQIRRQREQVRGTRRSNCSLFVVAGSTGIRVGVGVKVLQVQ